MTKSDQRIHDLLVRIAKSSNCKTHGPASPKAFQYKLMRLPKVYTEMIRAFSYVQVGKKTLMGYLHPDDPRSDRQKQKVDAEEFGLNLWANKAPRNEADSLDSEVFPIMVLGPLEYIVLWKAKIKDGDCPVIHWKPATKQLDCVDRRRSFSKNVVNKSFISWMNDLLDREGGSERQSSIVKLPRMRTVDYTVPRNATIEQICELFGRHPRVKVGKPASAFEIKNLESKLNVRLPKSVLTYLSTVGQVDINSFEICGLGATTKRNKELSMLEKTREWRRTGYPHLRNDLIVIHENGAGDAYCILVGSKRTAEASVVFWSHEDPRGEKQRVLPSTTTFTSFLREMLNDAPDI